MFNTNKCAVCGGPLVITKRKAKDPNIKTVLYCPIDKTYQGSPLEANQISRINPHVLKYIAIGAFIWFILIIVIIYNAL